MVRAFLILASCLATATYAKTSQPNVILIISDHMGYHDIEPTGASDIRTPALSRLAEQGVTMTNFYVAAPICGPSRAALYSGQYPTRLGFERNINPAHSGLKADTPTLPRWLKQAGYRTALFGKWHLGAGAQSAPKAHGFDEFFGHHAWTIGYYDHRTADGKAGLFMGDKVVHRSGYLTDLLTDATVSFIQHQQSQPFFITLAYNAGLPPYQPPGLDASQWHQGWVPHLASRGDYVQMVERMDSGIGQVLDTLDELGLAENTLVIYLYDHGGRHLVDSGPFFHGFGTLWEGGIRVPALLRLPKVIPADQHVALPAIAMDLTATIADVVGLESVAASLDGISLIPHLRNQQATPTRQLYWRMNSPSFGKQQAIREGRWKYIEHGSTQFLFDLENDLAERNNVYHQNQALANRLSNDLKAWLQSF